MHWFAMLGFSFFLALSSASPFSRSPSIKDSIDPSARLRDHIKQINQKDTQLPLTAPPTPGTQDTGITTLEISGWSFFGIPAFTTPIALGTPNQVFRVFLDLDFGGLLVRSVACDGVDDDGFSECGYGGDQGFVYNSSASETYKDADEQFHLMLPEQDILGNVSVDDVQLVNFGLEGVKFGEVEQFYGENYFLLILSDIADGALGLAPPNATAKVPYSNHTQPNMLSHLLTQAPLAKPLITFSLPILYTGELGRFTLGSLPPGYEDVEMSIPFGDLNKGWNLPLSSISLPSKGGEKDEVQIEVKDVSFYPTFTSGLALPHNLTETLYTHLHALPDSGWVDGREFNCSYRGKLPDISFNFNEVSISFAEEDYTLHDYFGDEEFCFLTIIEHEMEEGMDGVGGMDGVVQVGTMLWEKWHVIFNLEEGGQSMGLIAREDEAMTRARARASRKVGFKQMRRRAGS